VGKRYPLTSAWTESKLTRGRKGIYLKLGKRYADVVCISFLAGLEEGKDAFVIAILWYGCVRERH
jgi:hypothetical protein